MQRSSQRLIGPSLECESKIERGLVWGFRGSKASTGPMRRKLGCHILMNNIGHAVPVGHRVLWI